MIRYNNYRKHFLHEKYIFRLWTRDSVKRDTIEIELVQSFLEEKISIKNYSRLVIDTNRLMVPKINLNDEYNNVNSSHL